MNDLHARHVADVNARTIAAGRCVMHNPGAEVLARYVVELPIGNVIVLCADCRTWWLDDAAESGDPMSQPVRVTEIAWPPQPALNSGKAQR